MHRTLAGNPDLFCASFERSAAADLNSFAMMKALWAGAAACLRRRIPTRRSS